MPRVPRAAASLETDRGRLSERDQRGQPSPASAFTAPPVSDASSGLAPRGIGIPLAAGVGLAAVLLVALMANRGDPDRVEAVVADTAQTRTPVRSDALVQTGTDLDPASWWRSVQDRDWVGQTMPAVRSVREGVAPLGRSLMRAVTILAIGGRDQTS